MASGGFFYPSQARYDQNIEWTVLILLDRLFLIGLTELKINK